MRAFFRDAPGRGRAYVRFAIARAICNRGRIGFAEQFEIAPRNPPLNRPARRPAIPPRHLPRPPVGAFSSSSQAPMTTRNCVILSITVFRPS